MLNWKNSQLAGKYQLAIICTTISRKKCKSPKMRTHFNRKISKGYRNAQLENSILAGKYQLEINCTTVTRKKCKSPKMRTHFNRKISKGYRNAQLKIICTTVTAKRSVKVQKSRTHFYDFKKKFPKAIEMHNWNNSQLAEKYQSAINCTTTDDSFTQKV